MGKNIGVPNMNRKKTIEFIQREFSDMQRDEEENYPVQCDGGDGGSDAGR